MNSILKLPEDKVSFLHGVALTVRGGYRPDFKQETAIDLYSEIFNKRYVDVRGGCSRIWFWGLHAYMTGVYL